MNQCSTFSSITVRKKKSVECQTRVSYAYSFNFNTQQLPENLFLIQKNLKNTKLCHADS